MGPDALSQSLSSQRMAWWTGLQILWHKAQRGRLVWQCVSVTVTMWFCDHVSVWTCVRGSARVWVWDCMWACVVDEWWVGVWGVWDSACVCVSMCGSVHECVLCECVYVCAHTWWCAHVWMCVWDGLWVNERARVWRCVVSIVGVCACVSVCECIPLNSHNCSCAWEIRPSWWHELQPFLPFRHLPVALLNMYSDMTNLKISVQSNFQFSVDHGYGIILRLQSFTYVKLTFCSLCFLTAPTGFLLHVHVLGVWRWAVWRRIKHCLSVISIFFDAICEKIQPCLSWLVPSVLLPFLCLVSSMAVYSALIPHSHSTRWNPVGPALIHNSSF
jgi:hypothetical protein